jgi:hypothetical protein
MSQLPRDRVIFGTVEISDPRFEVEGLRDMIVRSPALGRHADLTVWVSEPATHPGSRGRARRPRRDDRDRITERGRSAEGPSASSYLGDRAKLRSSSNVTEPL